jgi:DNA primase
MFSYCKRTIYKRSQKVYNAECPVCNEGKSSGRKRRLFYFPDKRYFYCFNCTRSWKEVQWLQEVTNCTYTDILSQIKNYHIDIKPQEKTTLEVRETVDNNVDDKTLPDSYFDLEDTDQIAFYSQKSKDAKKINEAIEYCKSRRLFTAINRCKHYYYSLVDKNHSNRLILPFYNSNNQIECYQTRALLPNQYPKYLTKVGEKCLFGENNIDTNIPYIFVFEGPIDSMFVKNGVAMAGTDITLRQQHFLDQCVGYQQVLIYDNDRDNKSLQRKIKNKLKSGKRVFIWPDKFKAFKDVNEICCKLKIDEFNWRFIVENSFSGTEGIVKFNLSLNIN